MGTAAWAALLLVAALAWGAQAAAQELRLGASHGPVSLPIYVAEARGYFAQEGLKVNVHECSSGRHCFTLHAQGQVDVATCAELQVTLDSLANPAPSTAVIATLSASSRHIKLVARHSAGIQEPGDLHRKRIATVAGTSAQYFLDSWLVFHEIDPKEVTVVPLPPERLGSALTRGEVDALAIWEPVASAALAALGRDALVLPSPRIYTQHFNLVAGRPLIAQREAELLKLLRALARAQQFIATQPDQAMQLLKAQFPEEDPGRLAEHDYTLTLAQSLISTMDAQARWAVRHALVPIGHAGSTNLLNSIEPSLLRKAVPGAVALVR